MSQLKRYNGTSWETVGGVVTGDTLPVGSVIDYTGSTVPAGWEKLDEYSTSEVNTGKVWIDNKPIYRKVIYVSSLPNATSVDYPHNITNVDTIWIDLSTSFIQWSNGNTSPFNYLGSNSANTSLANAIEVRLANATKFSIETYNTNRSGLSAYVTLLYTKSTD